MVMMMYKMKNKKTKMKVINKIIINNNYSKI